MHPLSLLPFETPHIECAYCPAGVAEREVDDWSPDCGTGYRPINGSSHQDRHAWACPTCTARRLAEVAEFGCNLEPLAPPPAEREWKLDFERHHCIVAGAVRLAFAFEGRP